MTVLNPHKKYNLEYYLKLVDELVGMKIHILGIKDMAGVLKPKAATLLIGAIRKKFQNDHRVSKGKIIIRMICRLINQRRSEFSRSRGSRSVCALARRYRRCSTTIRTILLLEMNLCF